MISDDEAVKLANETIARATNAKYPSRNLPSSTELELAHKVKELIERQRWIPVHQGAGAIPKFAVNKKILSEEWAQRNHAQTLSRLAERGGLSLEEMAANVERRPFQPMPDEEAILIIYKYAGIKE